MKITDEIVRGLQKAINNKGSVDAAAKSTNVKTETLSQFLNRSTNSIRKETWDKLYPLIKPYMPPEKNEAEKSDPPELPEPPSHARMHPDLASLTSDEKILLDAFNDLPADLQQKKLLEMTELARSILAGNK